MEWIPQTLSQRWSVYVLGSVVLCAALGIFFVYSAPHTYVMVRTDSGFEPKEIRIQKGDTVRFENRSSAPMWPASDSHPTHGVYSAFDSLHPIEPGESWPFTFDRVGSWKLHDHLFAQVRGKVIVTGLFGNSVADCISNNPGSIQPQCWEAEMQQTIEEGGLDAAFDAVNEWYTKSDDFKRNCHDVMHIIGEEAYGLFLKDRAATDRPEVSYCGYGFFHGFVETMIAEEGFAQFDRVKAYCESVRSLDHQESIGPCYHGIGHATFDALESSLWGDATRMTDAAVARCEALLSDPFERTRCASGVYNALANALSAREYELTFDGWVAYTLCNGERARYQPFCYMELGNGYIRDQGWDTDTEVSFIQKMQPFLARTYVLLGYMDTEVRRHIDTRTPKDFTQLCERFESNEEVRACIDGALIGLRGVGEPGKEGEKIAQFCNAFSQNEQRAYCFDPAPFDF